MPSLNKHFVLTQYRINLRNQLLATLPASITAEDDYGLSASLITEFINGKWVLRYEYIIQNECAYTLLKVKSRRLFKAVWKMHRKIERL